MSLFRHKSNKKRAPPTRDLSYVDGTSISPAPTEYHDAKEQQQQQEQPRISVHQPTPNHEGQEPVYPSDTPVEETKGYQLADPGVTRKSTVTSRESRPTSVNEDTVLGTGDQASVNRSGTWAKGPGTSGVEEDGPIRTRSLAERASTASHTIGVEREATLSKAERKDAKRLSKIIKSEGKAEDRQLKSSIKELASLQSAQRKASAAEMAATHAQIKAAKEEQRASAAYLEAKTRFERAVANLKVTEERLVLCKDQAQKTTAMVRRQATDVEAMRERKAVDDREREIKLSTLKAGLIPQ